MLGDFAVGKTSLVRRFIHNTFDDRYLSTIGVKVGRKTVSVPTEQDVVQVTMVLWDLAGSERFDSVRASYLRGAAGALLVCDLTREETLEALVTYAANLRQETEDPLLMIVANKQDLPERRVGQADLERVAESLGAPLFLTSAKTGANVDVVFRRLAESLIP